MTARWLALLPVLALGACASLFVPAGETAGDVDALFGEMQRIPRLPREEQFAALAGARERHEARPDLPSAVRLALLLSLPEAPFQDDEAAALLLMPFDGAGGDSPLQRYAAVLRQQLRDKARLQRRAARLREELAAAHAIVGAEEAEARHVAGLVSYAHAVSALPPEEQRDEILATNMAHAERPSDFSKIRLALLLSLPGTPLHDDARALALLEPYKTVEAARPLQQFAALLHRHVTERTRDRKRSAQLKEQLEALRAIDRSLMERRKLP